MKIGADGIKLGADGVKVQNLNTTSPEKLSILASGYLIEETSESGSGPLKCRTDCDDKLGEHEESMQFAVRANAVSRFAPRSMLTRTRRFEDLGAGGFPPLIKTTPRFESISDRGGRLDRIIVGHGEVIEKDGEALLSRA